MITHNNYRSLSNKQRPIKNSAKVVNSSAAVNSLENYGPVNSLGVKKSFKKVYTEV